MASILLACKYKMYTYMLWRITLHMSCTKLACTSTCIYIIKIIGTNDFIMNRVMRFAFQSLKFLTG